MHENSRLTHLQQVVGYETISTKNGQKRKSEQTVSTGFNHLVVRTRMIMSSSITKLDRKRKGKENV